MPPRQKKKPVEDDDDDEDIEIEDDDEDEKPKGKAKPAPKKRAAKAGADEDGTKAKKPRAPPAKKITEPTTDGGWTCIPPSLIYGDFGSKPSAKIAGFDMDGCLIVTKSGADFARNDEDWRFICQSVPTELKKLHAQGYRIVLFSNQHGIKKALTGKLATNVKAKIEMMLKAAGVPALVMLATGADEYRKPSTGMWDYMCKNLSPGVEPDKSQSFFVGDAAGRPTDFMDKSTGMPSQTDKDFAAAVGIPFKVPQEQFGAAAGPGGCNAELVNVFKELAAYWSTTGGDKDHFKVAAHKKVAAALSGFEELIGAHNLKAVGALPGVGKGSVGIISEFLETGKVQELENIRASKGGGGAGPGPGAAAGPATAPVRHTEAAAQAMKFM